MTMDFDELVNSDQVLANLSIIVNTAKCIPDSMKYGKFEDDLEKVEWLRGELLMVYMAAVLALDAIDLQATVMASTKKAENAKSE